MIRHCELLVFLSAILFLASECAFTDLVKALSDTTANVTRQSVSCPSGEITCRDRQQCIRQSLLCNGHTECQDGSDERDCIKNCTSIQFKCDQNRCIPLMWRCDGQKDCLDNTDEDPTFCRKSTCPVEHFHCRSGECIPYHWKCDGTPDCTDGDDETPDICTKPVTCETGHRRCNNTRCISESLWCDGKADCSNGVDESNCTYTGMSNANAAQQSNLCYPDQFRCSHERCIPDRWLCDGWHDCENGEDETRPECRTANSTVSPMLAKLLLMTIKVRVRPVTEDPVDALRYWKTEN